MLVHSRVVAYFLFRRIIQFQLYLQRYGSLDSIVPGGPAFSRHTPHSNLSAEPSRSTYAAAG